jgi:8-oxo-dGTP pyrophosphatase MutT (NUDIX family)
MNSRIYFNDIFIELIEDKINKKKPLHTDIEQERTKKRKKLKSILNNFLNQKECESILINDFDLTDLIDLFKNQFYYIEAAGGFIENNQKYLFIHRHGRWDLPKGKLEKNETIENAAIRECEEECGVKNLTITQQLKSTFHIYTFKNSFALKQSYWFYMKTNYSEKLIPQIEENIDEVKWFSLDEIKRLVLIDTYFTISDVVKEGLGIK